MDHSATPEPAKAESAARLEIAARLHENLSQILCATAYLAAALRKDLEARDAAEAVQAKEVCAGLREASQVLRDLLTDLRASARPDRPPAGD